ncbi:SPOR domain-containing protein [Massilia sp. CF038]|uniref:SPOR domain-containing protein n=1 Tax=Massilia sp. CF038 TaxID=1881045 RepID=UPI000913B1BE|nr:SPOR domain-containing protein [Massilia sp. CF038]SHG50732.1 DedD protein [Massilia sp. CF038]
MGLFSFLNKNKQETADEDSGYVSRDDDESARARSKRASSAGEPAAKRGKTARAAADDPVLPEKKRARRRLVGAIALALAVAIGLPMVLDSEPKPLASDIDIRIPSKDKAVAQVQPRAEVRPPAPVAAADSLDKREEIVDVPKTTGAPVPLVTVPREVAEVRTPAVKPDTKPAKPEVKPLKPAEKPADKVADKPAAKPVKPEPKPEPKPVAKPDAERALAILEDKEVPAPAAQKYIVQVAALASQEKATELQTRLKDAGIPAFTQKGSGDLVRVRVGPFSKDEGEKVRAKLGKLGLSGSLVPN